MTPRTRSVLLWALVAVPLTLAILAPAIFIFGASGPVSVDNAIVVISYSVFLITFPLVGRLVATRHPANPIGWLMCGSSFTYSLAGVALLYTDPSLPGRAYVAAIGGTLWGIGSAFAGFALMLFPDGRFLSRLWKAIGMVCVVGFICLTVGLIIKDASLELDNGAQIANPLAVSSPIGSVLESIGGLTFFVVFLSASSSVILRFRRSTGEARMQMKWLAYGAFAVIASVVAAVIIENSHWMDPEVATNISNALESSILTLVPITIGIAILKYRLYDIDVVINKTIVFGALAAFITAVYVAIVVGFGALLGSQDKPNIALSITATAVVAIAFSPVKERVQRFANRLVYGTRQSPYQVLSDVAHVVATSSEPQDGLRAIARGAVLGTGASTAHVALVHDDRRVAEASWPEAADVPSEVLGFPITHRAEVVGQLSVSKKAGEPITPADRKLLDDLVSNAGLALYNARLNLQLARRLEEIRHQADDLLLSRERIVSAQDDSRRKLERDISAGPRQRLEQIESRLVQARRLLQRNPVEAVGVLEEIGRDATSTLDELRELARGLYPPLLADKGIVAALEAHVRKNELPVTIEANGVANDRFPQGVEACVFFCAVDLLSGMETAAVLKLERSETSVEFTLDPYSGSSVLRALQDRVEALDGRLEISTSGATLRGMVPARVKEGAGT